MRNVVPFKEVLAALEAHGWELQKVWEPYRVFTKKGKLPILIPVYHKIVSVTYVQ